MTQRKLKLPASIPSTGVPGKPGHLFILSAPSGAGKTTLRRAILDQFPDLLYSVSYTTREPRYGEQNGVDYKFITKDEFKKGIAGNRWAEWAEVHGNYYGTAAEFLNTKLASGRDVLLDIDIKGTRKILRRYPKSITIFIMPPSLEVLRQRLEARGLDRPEVVALRLKNAKAEMAQKELYHHVIINDQLSNAVAQLVLIIKKYRTVG